MWWDESLSHYRATQPLPFILSNRIMLRSGQGELATVDNHPPTYFVALRLLILTAGDSEFAMRFLSLAYVVLIVPLIERCGRRLFGLSAGLPAALLASISPLYLWYAQEIRPYAMVAFLGLLSFYALIRMLESRRLTVWAGIYVLSVAAMLTTHYLGFLLLVAEGLILALSWRRDRPLLTWTVLALGIVAAAVLVWGLSALPRQDKLPSFSFLPLGLLVNDVLQQFTLGLYADILGPLRWVAAGLLVASLVLLLSSPRRVPWQHILWALLCLALPVAEIYVISFVQPAYMNIRHLIFASPFYYILLGAGVAQARQRWARAPMGAAWLAVVAGMALSTTLYFAVTIHGRADHRGWGRYLSEHVRRGDLVIVNPGPVSELYEYYAETPAPWIGLPFLPLETDTMAYMRETVGMFSRIWVAYSSTPAWANQFNIPLNWLHENGIEVDFARFTSATTSLYVKAFRLHPPFMALLPEDVQPLALNFDDRLHLVGLARETERVTSGHVLQLRLYWSPVSPPDREYRVTLSLTDDQGFSWAERDYAPAHGAYPVRHWPVSRYVRDDVDVEIPPGTPPGRYRLNVSVYPQDRSEPALAARSLETGQLLGLIVPAGEVEVVRPDKAPPEREIPLRYETRRWYGAVSLLGHNYGGGAYRPGDVALLDAAWRANRRTRADLAFNLQLVDEGGTVRASRTVAPVDGYPTSQWHKGETVRGQYRFRIPIDLPAGRYSLAMARSTWPWFDSRTILSTLTVTEADAERTFELPDMQYTVGANLGDRVELLGYDLASDTVRPGQVVSCTLYWRALQVMSHNYTVFNHLVAGDGQTWGQWDNQPQRGTSPTTRWVPGQIVVDPYQIPVSPDAPPGRVDLHVGMYDLHTMIRLPVHDENGQAIGDHVAVVEIEVIEP